MCRSRCRAALLALGFVVCLASKAIPCQSAESPGERPNVVIVLTDDQGYGEMACHGNPILKTPNLDKLHDYSVRFSAFHVSPTCSPTRASLMTGRHEFRSGVTHTFEERERLALDAVTLPEVLKKAGYRTGIFGKWHLGDEQEYRPAQRGFDESFIHGAGGIGQSFAGSCGDFPGNEYFNPVVLHNEQVEQTEGYCTDVFFDRALTWIEENRNRPFFAYIATNAPHGPFICPEEYSKPYLNAGLDRRSAAYYGMIANIDENVGRLVATLDKLNLDRKTLVIFMTDNGHVIRKLYNAGMRGNKNTPYEGATRAAAFFHWPGTLPEGVEVPTLAAHIDILPTLAELCGAALPESLQLDGRSLVPLLHDANAPWEDRKIFFHCGRWERGQSEENKYVDCAVRTQQYRLVNHRELYDISADPGEEQDVAGDHPQVVAELQAAYDQWWKDIQPGLINENAPSPAENPFAQLYRQYVQNRDKQP